MHLSAEYAFCVMSLHCSVFETLQWKFILAICIALYTHLRCIASYVALQCGFLHCIALPVTFISETFCRGFAPVLQNLSVGYSSHLKSKHVGIFNKCIIKLLSFHLLA